MIRDLLRTGRWPTRARALLLIAVAACTGDGATSVEPVASISFSESELSLGDARTTTVVLTNTGTVALGPIEMIPQPVRDGADANVPGAGLIVTPPEVPTLNPGASATLTLSIEVGAFLQPGEYRTGLTARAGVDAELELGVRFSSTEPIPVEVDQIVLSDGPESVRQGDVARYTLEGRKDGLAVFGLAATWTVEPAGVGFMTPAGELVAYGTGSATVRATYGALSVTRGVEIDARGLSGSATRVGEGSITDRFTSDLWVYGDHAYTGTWGSRGNGAAARSGNVLHTWDVSDPTAPRRVHTLTVEARTVNDVKVGSDGTLGIITHEGSNDGLNGVTLLDLSVPGSPSVHARFTQGLESGIHNAWIEGDYAYLVVDGPNGLRVMDVRDPTAPSVVASFYAGSSFLHDVYVRDGLAFLSHWNAGLVILDVGNGIAGGSPTNPVEVSRLDNLNGQTHNAWYWPEAGYVFVGEEDFGSPGYMHVVDVRDLRHPVEVASYRAPGTTPHNFWLDEQAGVLYLAWYENGLRALDVNGSLLGELDRQGREIYAARYDGDGLGCISADGTCTWAPQLHNGRIFVSDMNNGLIVLRPSS